MVREGVFQVGDKNFKAHRLILSARSTMFAAMFHSESSFNEAKTGQLELADSTPDAVEALLQYIYTGDVNWAPTSGNPLPSLQETVLKLADKYALLDLKAHLESKLAERIDELNFFHLVYHADNHHCNGLKKECAHFFAGNRATIVQQEEWGKLRSERSELAAVLFEAAALQGEGK